MSNYAPLQPNVPLPLNAPLQPNAPLQQNVPLPLNAPLQPNVSISNNKFKILKIGGIIFIVIIILGLIIYGIIRIIKTINNNNDKNENNTIVNTKSVVLTKRVNSINTRSSINTKTVNNTKSSRLSLTDKQEKTYSTVNISGNVKMYIPPKNQKYVLGVAYTCENKELLGKMSIDEGIDKCNNCIGIQRVDDFVFSCTNITKSSDPDKDLWVNTDIINVNQIFKDSLAQSDNQIIPIGNTLSYNKYFNKKFNYSNVQKISEEPLLWLDAVRLCNSSEECIGIEYNGTGFNSFPIKIDTSDVILINRYIIPSINKNDIIYIKNTIKSNDGIPLVSDMVTDIITLP